MRAPQQSREGTDRQEAPPLRSPHSVRRAASQERRKRRVTVPLNSSTVPCHKRFSLRPLAPQGRGTGRGGLGERHARPRFPSLPCRASSRQGRERVVLRLAGPWTELFAPCIRRATPATPHTTGVPDHVPSSPCPELDIESGERDSHRPCSTPPKGNGERHPLTLRGTQAGVPSARRGAVETG